MRSLSVPPSLPRLGTGVAHEERLLRRAFFGYFNNSSATIPGDISLVHSVWGRPSGYIIPRPRGSVPMACIPFASIRASLPSFARYLQIINCLTGASSPRTSRALASPPATASRLRTGMASVLGSVPAALINPSDRALPHGPVPVHVTSWGPWCLVLA